MADNCSCGVPVLVLLLAAAAEADEADDAIVSVYDQWGVGSWKREGKEGSRQG